MNFAKIILPRLKFLDFYWDMPQLQSHRGAWRGGQLQENTIKAFARSRQTGFQMIEFDVRLTKDKIPVVFHDPDLKRMAGHEDLISQLMLTELQKLFPAPTLEEVLLSEDLPTYLNIEIKSLEIFNEDIERRIYYLLSRLKHNKKIMFSSFNPATLWKLANYLPHIPRAFLVTQEKVDKNSVWLREFLVAPMIPLHMLNLQEELARSLGLSFLKQEQIPFSVWTVNKAENVKELLQTGAQSVITDLDYAEIEA